MAFQTFKIYSSDLADVDTDGVVRRPAVLYPQHLFGRLDDAFVNRNPAASSASCPGVRMVMETAWCSIFPLLWKPRRISSGSSMASESVETEPLAQFSTR